MTSHFNRTPRTTERSKRPQTTFLRFHPVPTAVNRFSTLPAPGLSPLLLPAAALPASSSPAARAAPQAGPPPTPSTYARSQAGAGPLSAAHAALAPTRTYCRWLREPAQPGTDSPARPGTRCPAGTAARTHRFFGMEPEAGPAESPCALQGLGESASRSGARGEPRRCPEMMRSRRRAEDGEPPPPLPAASSAAAAIALPCCVADRRRVRGRARGRASGRHLPALPSYGPSRHAPPPARRPPRPAPPARRHAPGAGVVRAAARGGLGPVRRGAPAAGGAGPGQGRAARTVR